MAETKAQKQAAEKAAAEAVEPKQEPSMKVTTSSDLGEASAELSASGDAYVKATIQTSVGAANYEFKIVRHGDSINQTPELLADIMFRSLKKFFPEIKR